MAERMAEDCSSVEEVVKLFSFNKFLSLFPQEDAEFVQLKKSASIFEAANVMEEHIRRRGPSRDGYRKQRWLPQAELLPRKYPTTTGQQLQTPQTNRNDS